MSKLIGFVILAVLVGTSVAAGPQWGRKGQFVPLNTASPEAISQTIPAAALPVRNFEDMSAIFLSP
jgi:hypothetical protein